MQSGQKKFKETADTFELTVVLESGKLKVELKDLTQMKAYSKEYTEDDIGADKEIHKKAELEDLFNSFSSPVYKAQKSPNKGAFGLVHMIDASMQPQFAGGNPFVQNQSPPQTIFLSSKSNDQGNKNQSLRPYKFGQVIKLDQIPCYKIQHGGKITVYVNHFDKKTKVQNNYESKLCLNKIGDIVKEGDYKGQIQGLKKQNSELKTRVTKLEAQLGEVRNTMEKRIAVLESKIGDMMSSGKVGTVAVSPPPSIRYPTFISALPNPFSTNFSLTIDQITQTCPTGKWTNFFFNQRIPYSSPFSFKIRIVKVTSGNVIIGVADYSKQKQGQCCHQSGNAVGFYAHNGCRYPNGGSEGQGYTNGDILQTVVDLGNKNIKWFVDGKLKTSFNHDMLADRGRVFVPFLQLICQGDTVEWVDC